MVIFFFTTFKWLYVLKCLKIGGIDFFFFFFTKEKATSSATFCKNLHYVCQTHVGKCVLV